MSALASRLLDACLMPLPSVSIRLHATCSRWHRPVLVAHSIRCVAARALVALIAARGLPLHGWDADGDSHCTQSPTHNFTPQ